MKRYSLAKYLMFLSMAFGVLFWLFVQLKYTETNANSFADSYFVVPLLGSIYGLFAAKHWGGKSSLFGRIILAFSVGLLLQAVGQLTYSAIYWIWNTELAFPSVGDIPYVASQIAYIYGVFLLLKLLKPTGSRFKPVWISLVSGGLSLSILAGMIAGFLRLAVHDERGAVVQVLNVAYPLFQLLFIALALIAVLQARRAAEGLMFGSIAVLLSALAAQFVADYVLLYQSYHETWEPARVSDALYLLAYVLMGISIYYIEVTRTHVFSESAKAVQ